MRREINHIIFGAFAILCAFSAVACNEDPIEQPTYAGGNESALLKEFVVEYSSYQYSIPIDQESQEMTLGEMRYSALVSSVSATLADGAEIYPNPSDIDEWFTTQTFKVSRGEEEVTYTLNFPNKSDIVEFKSVGYITAAYFDYDNKINTIDWSNLSHVIMSFIQANADGSIQDSHAKLTERLNHLKTLKDENEFKLMIAIQSSATSSAQFYSAINTDEKRATLIANIIDYVDLHDLDGIDVDFEEYGYVGTTVFASFIEELGVAVEELEVEMGRDLLYSAAVAPNVSGYPSDLGTHLDFINLMIYDLGWNSLNAQHASYSHFTTYMSANYAQIYGATPRQLVGGLPFYGYTYDALGANSTASGSNGTQKAYYEIYTTYLSEYGADAIADGNQIENTVYNGRELIREKCDYVLANNYGGVMIWQIGQDLTDANVDEQTHKLLPVIGETLPFIEGKTITE
ncbi:MAG: glycosyl hydrolase family 18 protein [Rikenellaceae bacterium]